MTTTILLFGSLADAVGKSTLEIADCTDTDSLKEKCIKQFPQLEKYKFLISVNKKEITTNHQLEQGSEVAFLPPFAGG